ncbi:MAG: hypothetical protein H0T45_17340 [Pyrinomonadaceae bacterium]|nr:hypothetical protein [Pyrinomonadaceae bacterium]
MAAGGVPFVVNGFDERLPTIGATQPHEWAARSPVPKLTLDSYAATKRWARRLHEGGDLSRLGARGVTGGESCRSLAGPQRGAARHPAGYQETTDGRPAQLLAPVSQGAPPPPAAAARDGPPGRGNRRPMTTPSCH